MRFLGLDVGRATVGVAVADELLPARALHTIRRGRGDELAELARLAGEYEVDRVIVGLPLNMDGTEGDSARLARGFARKVADRLTLPVDLFDERLSTFEASLRLRDAGISARDGKARIDAEAAAVILQGWLDARAAGASR